MFLIKSIPHSNDWTKWLKSQKNIAKEENFSSKKTFTVYQLNFVLHDIFWREPRKVTWYNIIWCFRLFFLKFFYWTQKGILSDFWTKSLLLILFGFFMDSFKYEMKSLFPVFRFSGFISLFCINCSYFHVDKKSFNCNYVCKKVLT